MGFCPLFRLWDFVLWDSVLWDFVLWDSVLWDFVLWDSVLWDFVLWDFVLWDSVLWDSVRRDFVLWDSVRIPSVCLCNHCGKTLLKHMLTNTNIIIYRYIELILFGHYNNAALATIPNKCSNALLTPTFINYLNKYCNLANTVSADTQMPSAIKIIYISLNIYSSCKFITLSFIFCFVLFVPSISF